MLILEKSSKQTDILHLGEGRQENQMVEWQGQSMGVVKGEH